MFEVHLEKDGRRVHLKTFQDLSECRDWCLRHRDVWPSYTMIVEHVETES